MTMSAENHGDHAEHHVYDDIVEHDNPLPRWWLITLYGTIFFSLGYYFHYHVFKTAPTPADELAAENTAAAKALIAQGKGGNLGPEALLAMAQDQKTIQEGSTTFQQMCASCHGDKAEGKIGPNLTDRYWIHGGKPDSVYKVISKGAPEKGMPAWEPSLGPRKTQVVAAYVLSLKGKNVPGKEPQGQQED
jgi:cytochrome c oxidase cbb3-type subunit 3